MSYSVHSQHLHNVCGRYHIHFEGWAACIDFKLRIRLAMLHLRTQGVERVAESPTLSHSATKDDRRPSGGWWCLRHLCSIFPATRCWHSPHGHSWRCLDLLSNANAVIRLDRTAQKGGECASNLT